MRADLMPRGIDLADELGIFAGHPSQTEEGRLRFRFLEQLEDTVEHARKLPVETAPRVLAPYRVVLEEVKPLLDVEAEDMHQ